MNQSYSDLARRRHEFRRKIGSEMVKILVLWLLSIQFSGPQVMRQYRLQDMDSGDHLDLNSQGHQAMANAFPVNSLEPWSQKRRDKSAIREIQAHVE